MNVKLFKALQEEFGDLSCACIDTIPLDFDFGKGYTETWDIAINAYREECEKCNGKGHIECAECVADQPGRMVCEDGCKDGIIYDAVGNGTECSTCDGDGYMDCNCKSEDYPNGQIECEECNGEGNVESDDPDRWFPMMNCFYPITDRLELPEKPWEVLECTTIVDIEGMDGYALALTGGGMDLSWEICRSFVNLGLLPPVHFAKLPRMGGRGTSERDKQLLRACLYSLMIKARWIEQSAESIIAEHPEAFPEKEAPHTVMAEHLTVYVDDTHGAERFYVDNDHADNQDGTRNPETSGISYSRPNRAAAAIERWLEHQSPNFPNVPEGIFPTRSSGDFSS